MSAAAAFQTGHIGLNVTDVQRSKGFYQQVFGFEIFSESEQGGREYAMLGADGKIVLTLWQQSSGGFSKDRPGLHHLSFMVDTMHEIEHVEGRLREMKVHFLYDGIVPHAEGSHSGGIFFEDPDSIRLEVFTANGAEELDAPSDGPSCGLF